MSNKFTIDPKSADFNEIYSDVDAHVKSAPEAIRWKDDYNNSAGKIIKEMVAGNATFKKVEAILARREAYLMSAQNRSSVVGMAQYKGYSVFRGNNTRMTGVIIPDFTGTLPKLSVIGRVLDVDLVLLADTAFIEGTPVSCLLTVGDVKEDTKVITSDRPNFFRFYRNTASEDIDLFLNDERVEISNRMVDAELEKFVTLSNPFGSIDVFYLNKPSFTTRYTAGDVLKLRFVNLDDKDFQLSDVTLQIGQFQSLIFTSNFEEEETKEAIKVNAPIYAETQFLIRAREDYLKLFRLLETSIVSTNYKNISPMVVRLYYVRGDDVLYSQAEKASLISRLSINRNMGLEPPEIGDSIRAKIHLLVDIKVYQVSGSVPQDASAIIDEYQNKLGASLDFEEIEHDIEEFSTVKVARITIGSTPWISGQYYEAEQHVSPSTPNGLIYRAKDILRYTGVVEPLWPTTVGDTITDGDLIWKCKYLERQCNPITPILPIVPPRPEWEAVTPYELGQIIIPNSLDIYEYELVGFRNMSDVSEPVWPKREGLTAAQRVGAEVSDARLVWRTLELTGTPAAWSANTHYELGAIVISTNPTTQDTAGLMYQLVAVTGRTAGAEPTWPTLAEQTVVDGTIRWEARSATKSPKTLQKDRFYKIQRTIVLT